MQLNVCVWSRLSVIRIEHVRRLRIRSGRLEQGFGRRTGRQVPVVWSGRLRGAERRPMGLLEGVYRAIGAVAKVNRRLSLMRINFLPLNLLLMGALALGLSIGVAQLRDVQNNSAAPLSQPLTTILGPGAGSRSFVTVSGTLFAAGRLDTGRRARAASSNASTKPGRHCSIADRGRCCSCSCQSHGWRTPGRRKSRSPEC